VALLLSPTSFNLLKGAFQMSEESTINQPKEQEQNAAQPMSREGVISFGVYFIVLSVVLLYLLVSIWPPTISQATPSWSSQPVSLLFGWLQFHLSDEVRLILIVILAGALGSYVHSATSFSDYVGNRELVRSWSWWYILRPFIGVSLALVFYFVIRAGFFSPSAAVEATSPYGFAAIAGLVGMFSKQATDKLSELFDTLFKTAEPERRSDSLET
jgi:magnesium-transporting ATPase (P-type)